MKKLTVELAINTMEQIHHFPAVSIIMPFNPKMCTKKAIDQSLSIELGKIDNDLQVRFPDEMSRLVMQKLQAVLRNLDFSTHSISIAIFISPVFEKLFYLNFPVEKRVVVDESFGIRDLVYCKKEVPEYLVLQLSQGECSLYLGSPGSLVRILSNTPEYVPGCLPSVPVSADIGSSKADDLKTINYLRYMDNVLDIILSAYPRPLFVLGNTTITSYFKGVTRHAVAIISYMEGDYEKANAKQLKNILQPQVADWGKVRVKWLLNQLENATNNRHLVKGLSNVWHEAVTRGGHLLVFEKGYPYSLENRSTEKVIYEALKPYNSFSCIKDQLDEAIGRILENGGNVEVVDNDILKAYDHIALLR